jgi:hypothetical protein
MNLKTTAIAIVALAATISQAQVTITLDQTSFDVIPGSTWQFTGTVTATSPFVVLDEFSTGPFPAVTSATPGWWESSSYSGWIAPGTYPVALDNTYTLSRHAVHGTYNFTTTFQYSTIGYNGPSVNIVKPMTIHVVPEPSTVFGILPIGLLLARRRKAK